QPGQPPGRALRRAGRGLARLRAPPPPLRGQPRVRRAPHRRRPAGGGRHARHGGARQRPRGGHRATRPPVLRRAAVAPRVPLAADAPQPALHRLHPRRRGARRGAPGRAAGGRGAERARQRGRDGRGLKTIRPLVIVLAGGTGSGKTTVARALLRSAGEGNAVLLPQDAYYREQADLPFEARELTNYDEPSAFDTELLVRHVDQLLSGEAVERPVYDFAQHNRAPDTVLTPSAPVVIVEGILVLHDVALRERMRLKVFVDA